MMRQILVTRPKEDFKRTADNLAQLGFEALSAPMMDFNQILFSMPEMAEVAALIFTSANGIRAVKDRAEFKAMACYVVGAQTAKLAAECGFEILGQGAGNVSSLCEVIAQDYLARGFDKPLLHISGVHQAGNLSQSLAELSIATHRLQAYEMQKVADIAVDIEQRLESQTIDAILLYSARSAKIFIEIMKNRQILQKISDIPVFCLSKNIAEALGKPYLTHIYFVDQPDEDALLALMQEKLKIDPFTQI